MLLQTNSYFVPKEKRTEHARLVKRFRALMLKLGCEDFDVCEQTGPNWTSELHGRFVQLMRFRDEAHQRAVREAEQSDASAQDLVREFCELVDYGYQQQQGMATTAYYRSLGSAPVQHAFGSNAAAAAQPAIPADDSIEPPIISNLDVDLDEVPPIESPRHGAKHTVGRNGEIDD